MRYENLYYNLMKMYDLNKFSLALHTTNSGNANRILKSGLEERCYRTIEGTIRILGDMANEVEMQDLDYFFPYTDATVVVAIPSFLETKRLGNSESGNKTTCEFSKFLQYLENSRVTDENKHLKEQFVRGDKKVIPTELIVGYYEQNGNFTKNENCVFFEKDSSYLKDLEVECKNEKLLKEKSIMEELEKLCMDN